MTDYSIFRKNITSQNGEDGILSAVIERLNIVGGWCVEFGAWDGKHLSNTWNLWHNLGWSAILIEGDPIKAKDLSHSISNFDRVSCICRYVSSSGEDRLDNLLASTNIPKDFDVLSIDVDGDDWHIWNAFLDYYPKLVLCEFSMWFPSHIDVVNKPGNNNLGCSARALVRLGISKGYELICCNNVNAIFIRSDLYRQLGLLGTSEDRLVLTHTHFDLRWLSTSIFKQIASVYIEFRYLDELDSLATGWLTRLLEDNAYADEVLNACREIIVHCPRLKFSYQVLSQVLQSVGHIKACMRTKLVAAKV